MYKGEDEVIDVVSKNKKTTLTEISKKTSLNEDTVRRITESLKASGHIITETSESVSCSTTNEFDDYYANGFPEFSVFMKAQQGVHVKDLSGPECSIGLRWAKVKGFVLIENGNIIPAKTMGELESEKTKMKYAYEQIRQSGNCDDPVLLHELAQRHLIKKSTKIVTFVSYTGKPFSKDSSGFDVNVPAANATLGKTHPITKMTRRIRSIMTDMGFKEMEGNLVESSFWNFDALFQPQDHPARELADTFYLNGEISLPNDKKLVERVKKSHEDGWKYDWSPKEASKAVLRTHTTALSARYVAAIKDKAKSPQKYFAIGRVFRNEATDYKHLAEFHQVEGIIVWENATFSDLLGTLKEFYRKLGFEKIRFRPSFFPYTEPSLEVEVYFEKKKQWLELGGAGIFRPEVSIPLAGVYPVLAWGLSLERPLMLLLDLDDIRTFYKNDLDFLVSPNNVAMEMPSTTKVQDPASSGRSGL
ncbi:phenylalanine--tRNA ligase subunit alpha [Candidatus Micrarchaeota archaeon]|nr:phenylalanine--tRNA ligase subunit alpha [Candidatus Micrarchaeota archaeon]MBU1165448.1 phenylalanine--tRNA ligase subunit alpha [Candidatus Micrarchaeota archaeon]MBU1887429.1 phenylalanine--tRNA ligase subunit alpha [Candidatus Micrarchaeota archaeon]